MGRYGNCSLENLLEIAPQLPTALGRQYADALGELQERLGAETVKVTAFEHLRALIATTTEATTRFRLLKWSGALRGHPGVLALLVPYLNASDTSSRHRAVLGLLRTGRTEVLDLLKAHLAKESDPDVRDSIESGLALYERQP